MEKECVWLQKTTSVQHTQIERQRASVDESGQKCATLQQQVLALNKVQQQIKEKGDVWIIHWFIHWVLIANAKMCCLLPSRKYKTWKVSKMERQPSTAARRFVWTELWRRWRRWGLSSARYSRWTRWVKVHVNMKHVQEDCCEGYGHWFHKSLSELGRLSLTFFVKTDLKKKKKTLISKC